MLQFDSIVDKKIPAANLHAASGPEGGLRYSGAAELGGTSDSRRGEALRNDRNTAYSSSACGAAYRASDEWGRLMASALEGNAASYRQLLDEVRNWLCRFFARRVPPAFVEDLVQETLITLHEKRRIYDPQRPFKPWLAQVARHKWIDCLRRMRRSRAESLTDDIAVDDHGNSVTSAVILRKLLINLNDSQSHVILMTKVQGLSVEEASARTGQSRSLVKVNVHRGIKTLSSIVAAYGSVSFCDGASTM
jgi:RNA polymerase sigma factor (sigma-70 family)